MPNRNYQIGYSLELRTRKLLEKLGFYVVRPAMSKGAADLVAFNKKAKYFVQCKKTHGEEYRIRGLTEILNLGKKYDAKPLLAYAFYNSPIYVKEITRDREALKENAIHQNMEKYLKSAELTDEYCNYMAEEGS